MNIGEQIKQLRMSHNLSQEALAEKSGIPLSSIRKYEIGDRNPKIDQLSKIAHAMGISVNVFINFDINTISDVFSLLFKMDEQLNINVSADKKADGTYDPNTVTISFKNNILNHNLCSYLDAIKGESASIENISTTKTKLLNDNTVIASSSDLSKEINTIPQKTDTTDPVENLQKLISTASLEDKTWAMDMIKLISKKIR